MSPVIRTPQQRDRRFSRVRRLTQVIFVGAGAVSAALVGFVAANATPVTTSTVTTTPHATTTTTKSTPGSVATTVPTTAPVTHTTVCYSTPSGNVVCH